MLVPLLSLQGNSYNEVQIPKAYVSLWTSAMINRQIFYCRKVEKSAQPRSEAAPKKPTPQPHSAAPSASKPAVPKRSMPASFTASAAKPVPPKPPLPARNYLKPLQVLIGIGVHTP
jgi:hypothetical protein